MDADARHAEIERLRVEAVELARLKADGVDVAAREAEFTRRAHALIEASLDGLAVSLGHLKTTVFAAVLAAGREN